MKKPSRNSFIPNTRQQLELPFIQLENHGTDCFINSALQFIMSFNKHSMEPINISDALVVDMTEEEKQNLDVAQQFVQLANIQLGNYYAQEFTTAFLKAQPQIRPRTMDDVTLVLYPLMQNTYIFNQNPFHFQMENLITCSTCHSQSPKVENYSSWIVKVPTNPINILQNMLENYMVEGLVGDNQYQCDVCNGKRDAVGQRTMISCPDVLIIQLARFIQDQNRFYKNNNDVFIPCNMIYFPCNGIDHRYELKSVISHRGNSLQSGHYLTYVKKELQWYEIDDDRITKCNPDRMKPNQITILAFTKRLDN